MENLFETLAAGRYSKAEHILIRNNLKVYLLMYRNQKGFSGRISFYPAESSSGRKEIRFSYLNRKLTTAMNHEYFKKILELLVKESDEKEKEVAIEVNNYASTVLYGPPFEIEEVEKRVPDDEDLI